MSRPLLPPAAVRRKVDVYLSDVERDTLMELARAARLPLSTFVRVAALGKRIEAPAPKVNLTLWRELARVAANLNQLARAVNSGVLAADLAVLGDLSEAVRALRLSLVSGECPQ